MKKRRIFALTLHGWGDYYHEPLVRQGRLPNVCRLMAAGSSGPLRSPYPISAATWVTMFTGQSVGVHGAIDYVQVDARTYHGTLAELADTATFRDETIFSIASRAGKKVAALFLPMTYPPWQVDGVMVSGFPLPDDRFPPTYPRGLAETIGQVAPTRLLNLRYENKEAIETYLRATLSRLEQIVCDVWQGDSYDMMLACLPMPDLAHHYFWARDDPQAFERIYRIYDRVDETVGRLLAMVDEDDYFVMFSDHGTGPAPHRRFYFNRWLANEGLLQTRSSLAERLGVASAINGAINGIKRARIHHRLRRWIRGPMRRGVTSLTHNNAFVEWERTRAYGIEFFYPLVGFEVNLQGRQSHGVVSPGTEYERLRDELCARLERLVDPETGQRVCRRVCRREEMFHGSHLHRFPDVVAALNPDYDGRIHMEPAVFADNTARCDYPFMGYHGDTGLFAMRGPGIAAGRKLPPNEMIDLAPTLLDLLGLPIPDTMEGEPFPSLRDA